MDLWESVRATWEDARARMEGPASPSGVIVRTPRPTTFKPITVPIAVAGFRGAGKSVLGESFLQGLSNGFIPSTRSEVGDFPTARVTVNGRSADIMLGISVGQRGPSRENALETMMRKGYSPRGLIYPVCWGYNTVWEEDLAGVKLAVSSRGGDPPDPQDPDKLRKLVLGRVRRHHLERELEDFEDTCEKLKSAWRGKQGIWLMIPVNKADLYWNDLDQAADYYLPRDDPQEEPPVSPREPPGHESPEDKRLREEAERLRTEEVKLGRNFARTLSKLVSSVGESAFDSIIVLPHCSTAVHYAFDDTVLHPTEVDGERVSAVINCFDSILGETIVPSRP